jgi:hypothetical protein
VVLGDVVGMCLAAGGGGEPEMEIRGVGYDMDKRRI